MESEHDQKNTNSNDGQSNVASLVTMYRYPFRVEEAEETWAELPDLLLEEIYILLANRWRSYCSQVCIISFQKNFSCAMLKATSFSGRKRQYEVWGYIYVSHKTKQESQRLFAQ